MVTGTIPDHVPCARSGVYEVRTVNKLAKNEILLNTAFLLRTGARNIPNFRPKTDFSGPIRDRHQRLQLTPFCLDELKN